MGEQLKEKVTEEKTHVCVVCKEEKTFKHYVVTKYFTAFFIPLWGYESSVDTWFCESCGLSQPINTDVDSQSVQPWLVDALKTVLLYFALGYGVSSAKEVVADIISELTKMDVDLDELDQTTDELSRKGMDVMEYFKQARIHLTFPEREKLLIGVGKIIKQYSEWQFDDQVKVNMLGTQLEIDISYTKRLMGQL